MSVFVWVYLQMYVNARYWSQLFTKTPSFLSVYLLVGWLVGCRLCLSVFLEVTSYLDPLSSELLQSACLSPRVIGTPHIHAQIALQMEGVWKQLRLYLYGEHFVHWAASSVPPWCGMPVCMLWICFITYHWLKEAHVANSQAKQSQVGNPSKRCRKKKVKSGRCQQPPGKQDVK